MKISLNWLKQFVDYNGTTKELADLFWSLGLESETLNNDLVEVEITPNRGDCLSIMGIAREVAAKENLRVGGQAKPKLKTKSPNKKLKVHFENARICPRYSYYLIDKIKITASPKWLVERLKSVGFRSINNIVDITNFVMLELGQPLHAFDYDKIAGKKMKVRLTHGKEKITTLDDQNYQLPDQTIIIEDKEKIIDLAGIMGGQNSQVDEKTKTIILQAAIFDPILIRQTSRALQKTNDASYRYERAVDYKTTTSALERSAELILETCPHAEISELFDFQNEKYEPTKIKFNVPKINQLLGANYNEKQINNSLVRLGFKLKKNLAFVPSWRKFDLKSWSDLTEEIARLDGYDKIENKKLAITKIEDSRSASWRISDFSIKNSIRDYLRLHNFDEVINYSFADKKEMKSLKIDFSQLPEIAGAVDPKIKFYRGSLIAGLAKTIAQNPSFNKVKIFEIGDIWENGREKTFLGLAVSGKNEMLFKNLFAGVIIESIVIGANHELAKIHKLKRVVTVAEIAIEKLKNLKFEISNSTRHPSLITHYSPISKFPPVVRDLAIIVNKNIKAQNIIETIKKISKQILIGELFDEYINPRFGKNKKSLAFHLVYQNLNCTMTDKKADQLHQKVIKIIKEKFGAQWRGKDLK